MDPISLSRRSCLAAGVAGLLFQGKSPVKPAGDEPKKSPAQLEKERIERELEGVWEVHEYFNPKIRGMVKASGYMMVQQGWMSVNLVVTSRDPVLGNYRYSFVGSMKRYEVTDQNRLKLTNSWGFSNEDNRLTPDADGQIDERQIFFIGEAELGQKLKIARSPDDAMTFMRRSPVLKPKEPAPATK
jgi:hypothetical protein